jgi:hypothetical protein
MNPSVEIKLFPGKGRGLVTTRKVATGEPVVVEQPLLLTVSQEAKDHACAHCLCWLERCPGKLSVAAAAAAAVVPAADVTGHSQPLQHCYYFSVFLHATSGAVGCDSCQQVRFCSAHCQQLAAAKPWVHAPATCRYAANWY